MKRILTIMALLGGMSLAYAQTTMFINKTNGTADSLLLSEVKSITFRTSQSGSNSFIIYSKSGSGVMQIWRMNPDGSSNSKISDITEGSINGMSLSPDRTRIAFSAGPDNGHSLYVMNLDGTGKTKIASPNTDFLFYYSPKWKDNNRLFVQIARTGNVGKRDGIEVDADGRSIVWLTQTSTRSVSLGGRSPDGAKIAFAEGTPYAGATTEVYVADYPTFSNKIQIANPESPGAEEHIRWSVLNKIVFAGSRIHTVNPDGTGLTTLSATGTTELYPVFSPDGSQIAYLVIQSGIYSIKIMNADGSNKTTLLTAPTGFAFGNLDWK